MRNCMKCECIVKGVVDGRDFKETVEIELIPPSDEQHYGNGYYMSVKTDYDRKLIDVRYERNIDIGELSGRYIRMYYGSNLLEWDCRYVYTK